MGKPPWGIQCSSTAPHYLAGFREVPAEIRTLAWAPGYGFFVAVGMGLSCGSSAAPGGGGFFSMISVHQRGWGLEIPRGQLRQNGHFPQARQTRHPQATAWPPVISFDHMFPPRPGKAPVRNPPLTPLPVAGGPGAQLAWLLMPPMLPGS